MLIFALEYVLIVPGSEFSFNGIEHPIKQNRPRGQPGYFLPFSSSLSSAHDFVGI
jgi:hypothetical protein